MNSSPRIWRDGREVAPEAATVSVFDRGFLLGDTIFETLRAEDGVPLLLEEHLSRLASSAQKLGHNLGLGRDELAREMSHAIRAAGFAHASVRLTVSRGRHHGRMRAAAEVLSERWLMISEVGPRRSPLEQAGIVVAIQPGTPLAAGSLAEGAKVGNYAGAIAAWAATAADVEEVLLEDPEGHILEGTVSNLFWCKEDALHTAPLSTGILPGVTRKALLSVAQELGIEIRFTSARRDDLLTADELFLTTSIRGLLGVGRVGTVSVGLCPGPMLSRLYPLVCAREREPGVLPEVAEF